MARNAYVHTPARRSPTPTESAPVGSGLRRISRSTRSRAGVVEGPADLAVDRLEEVKRHRAVDGLRPLQPPRLGQLERSLRRHDVQGDVVGDLAIALLPAVDHVADAAERAAS